MGGSGLAADQTMRRDTGCKPTTACIVSNHLKLLKMVLTMSVLCVCIYLYIQLQFKLSSLFGWRWTKIVSDTMMTGTASGVVDLFRKGDGPEALFQSGLPVESHVMQHPSEPKKPRRALYQEVKAYVLDLIKRKEWPPHYRVPSEHALVERLGVSRMTVNRALRELSHEGRLYGFRGWAHLSPPRNRSPRS